MQRTATVVTIAVVFHLLIRGAAARLIAAAKCVQAAVAKHALNHVANQLLHCETNREDWSRSRGARADPRRWLPCREPKAQAGSSAGAQGLGAELTLPAAAPVAHSLHRLPGSCHGSGPCLRALCHGPGCAGRICRHAMLGGRHVLGTRRRHGGGGSRLGARSCPSQDLQGAKHSLDPLVGLQTAAALALHYPKSRLGREKAGRPPSAPKLVRWAQCALRLLSTLRTSGWSRSISLRQEASALTMPASYNAHTTSVDKTEPAGTLRTEGAPAVTSDPTRSTRALTYAVGAVDALATALAVDKRLPPLLRPKGPAP